MTSHRCQHNFTFSTIKNGARQRINLPLPFVLFLLKEKEEIGENVIVIKTCANWFKNDLKTMISISTTKSVSNAVQLWKRTNCGKIRKSGKRLKILRLIYIVSIFLILIKKLQKIGWNICTDLIKSLTLQHAGPPPNGRDEVMFLEMELCRNTI